MIRNRYLLFVLGVLVSLSLQAQIGASSGASSMNSNHNEEIMNRFLKGMEGSTAGDNHYDGTPYYDVEFKRGFLIFPENDPLPAKIRYNVVKEEMEVQMDAETFRVVHDGLRVKIAGTPFKKFTYREEDKSITLLGYFEILTAADEEVILLKKHYKDVKRGKAAAAMQKATPPRYVDKDDFYLNFKDSNLAVLVERKQKDFLDLFPEEEQEDLEEFMEENNLKPRKEEDLYQIVNYYNSK